VGAQAPAAPAGRYRKVLPIDGIKVVGEDGGAGTVSGYGSTFGNVDRVGDVIVAGAFADTIEQFKINGFIAWGHDWSMPVAYVTDAFEDERGLYIEATFHTTPEAQRARRIVQERAAAGKSMGLSIGFDIPPGGREIKNGISYIKRIELFEVSLVTVPANPEAQVAGVKELSDQDQKGGAAAAVAPWPARWPSAGATVKLLDDGQRLPARIARSLRSRPPAADGEKEGAAAQQQKYWVPPAEGSYEDLISDLREAVCDLFDDYWCWCEVVETYPGFCIARICGFDDDADGRYYRIAYTIGDDLEPVLGEITPVQPVWVAPVPTMGAEMGADAAVLLAAAPSLAAVVAQARGGQKAGRVLSQANVDRLSNLATALQTALDDLRELLSSTGQPKDASDDDDDETAAAAKSGPAPVLMAARRRRLRLIEAALGLA
jgi:HK97 family phage prohead protease